MFQFSSSGSHVNCLLCIVSMADSRFVSYLPSVLATATMLHVISSVEPCLGVEYQTQIIGILGINKVSVHCTLH